MCDMREDAISMLILRNGQTDKSNIFYGLIPKSLNLMMNERVLKRF